MRLLWVPQISTIDKTTHKFTLDADSNIVVFHNYKDALLKLGVDITVTLPLRKDATCSDPNMFAKVDIMELEYPKDVFHSRFFLDKRDAMRILSQDYDWILVNDPCLVAQWKILAREKLPKTKFATINHWIDNPSYPKVDPRTPYAFRQLEGMYISDVAFTPAITGYNAIVEMAEHWLSCRAIVRMLSHTHVLENPIDASFYKPNDNYDEKIMLFSHRCSSFPLYKDNFNKFKSACAALKEIGYKFDTIVTNPSGYAFSEEDKKQFDNVGPFTRNVYLDILHHHPIMSAFFEVPPLWPTTLLEGAVCGCPIVVPNEQPYQSMFGFDYEGLNKKDQFVFLSVFKALLDSPAMRQQMGISAREQMKRFTPEVQAQKLLDILSAVK